MRRRAGLCAAESELSWKSQTKMLGCRGQITSRTERAQQGWLDLPMEPEALSPPLFAEMTWPELFFGCECGLPVVEEPLELGCRQAVLPLAGFTL